MQTKEYTYIDRTGWPKGEWDTEPDKVQWQDEATGLPCLARRVPMGHWCGYVGVAEGHPLFGKDREEFGDLDLSAHGGVNFGAFCNPSENEHGVCHVPDPGEPDHVWWLGFDCGHAWDLAPGMQAKYRELGLPDLLNDEVYRPLGYVKQQCAELARQLEALACHHH